MTFTWLIEGSFTIFIKLLRLFLEKFGFWLKKIILCAGMLKVLTVLAITIWSAQSFLYDLHTFMDAADLMYHFGVNDAVTVPPYELTTPEYVEAYKDFPRYLKKTDWVYPSELQFDISAFDKKYTVKAKRNDLLLDPKFFVKYYGNSHESFQSPKLLASELQRHYTAATFPAGETFDADDVNSAVSFSEDGVRGILQGSGRFLRIVPIRKVIREKYVSDFDVRHQNTDANCEVGTHLVFEVSERPHVKADLGVWSAETPYQFQTKKTKKPYNGIKASVKLGILVDYSTFKAFMEWQFTKESHQIFFVLAFYNEVQLMYKEKTLRKRVRLNIAVQSIGFFTSEQNDLGADHYALNYLKNICEGPYNNDQYDHMQSMRYIDIYDKNRRKKDYYRREMDDIEFQLPRPIRYKTIPNYRPIVTNPQEIPENLRAYDTIGLAWVGAICHKKRHCSVVEMNSPIASFSAAHELGHNLGLVHEEENRECNFNPKDPDRSSFMSSMSWGSNAWATKGAVPVLTECSITKLITSLRGSSKCVVKAKRDRTEPTLKFKTVFKGICGLPTVKVACLWNFPYEPNIVFCPITR